MPVMIQARVKCDNENCLEEQTFHVELGHNHLPIDRQVPEGWVVDSGPRILVGMAKRFTKTYCPKHVKNHTAQRSG